MGQFGVQDQARDHFIMQAEDSGGLNIFLNPTVDLPSEPQQ